MIAQLRRASLVSSKDLSRDTVLALLEAAREFKCNPRSSQLAGRIIANCFFEPSTRTRLSFEVAAKRLGAEVIGFSSDDAISAQKGESLQDSIRVIGHYADLMVLRHPWEGAARLAAAVAGKPIINAGDGGNQHPTQALIDLFTMWECQPKLEGLQLALVGDLKYGRTVHSLMQLCALFNMRFYLVAPPSLGLPDMVCDALKVQGIPFSFHTSLKDILPRVDVVYMTRYQRERFSSAESAAFEGSASEQTFRLTPKLLEQAQSHLKVLHPLPRLTEIDPAVDLLPQAHYFTQAANGIPVRMALLAAILV